MCRGSIRPIQKQKTISTREKRVGLFYFSIILPEIGDTIKNTYSIKKSKINENISHKSRF